MWTRRRHKPAALALAVAALLALVGCRSTETVKSGGAIEQAKAMKPDSGIQQAVAKVNPTESAAAWPGLEPASSGAGCSH